MFDHSSALRFAGGAVICPHGVQQDVLVRHWLSVMAEGAGEQDERGKEGRHHNALFYADDYMVALSDL